MRTRDFLSSGILFGIFGCFGCIAQSSEATRVAHILSTDFETVVYTDSRFLLNFKDDGQSEDSLLGMRLPYIEWMAALKFLSPSAEDDLELAYGSIAVGAKEFRSPVGIGMVGSSNCYVAILKGTSQPDLDSDFARAGKERIGGRTVWTWTLRGSSDDPRTMTFYAAQVGRAYFVLANSRVEFEKMYRQLTGSAPAQSPKVNIFDWDDIGTQQYWAFRRVRRYAVADPGAAALAAMHPSTVAFSFAADIAKRTSEIQVLSTDKTMAEVPKILPEREQLRFQPDGPGLWHALVPLTADRNGMEIIARLFQFFGNGLAL